MAHGSFAGIGSFLPEIDLEHEDLSRTDVEPLLQRPIAGVLQPDGVDPGGSGRGLRGVVPSGRPSSDTSAQGTTRSLSVPFAVATAGVGALAGATGASGARGGAGVGVDRARTGDGGSRHSAAPASPRRSETGRELASAAAPAGEGNPRGRRRGCDGRRGRRRRGARPGA